MHPYGHVLHVRAKPTRRLFRALAGLANLVRKWMTCVRPARISSRGGAMLADDGATPHAPQAAHARPSSEEHARRFRPTLWSALQAWRIKLWLNLVGKGLFRFQIEVEGREHIPRGEPLIIAAAPHRGWIDPMLILSELPPLPRAYFFAAVGLSGDRW